MASGGVRRGAGRPKGASTKFGRDTAAEPAPSLTPPPSPAETPEGDENDPDYLLGLVQRGFEFLPDGRKVTREMVWAAKERMAYHKAKRATTNDKPGANKPLPELTDAELKAIIADEIAARSVGHGAAGAPGGAEGLHLVVRTGAAPAAASASKASQAALLEIAAGGAG